MMEPIKLVQGDTKPVLYVDVIDVNSGNPLDISSATVRLKLRMDGATTLKETLIGTILTGRTEPDGTVITTAPYDVAGKGGRVSFAWTSTSLSTPGTMVGEVEATFSDMTVQSVYEVLRFRIRGQFA